MTIDLKEYYLILAEDDNALGRYLFLSLQNTFRSVYLATTGHELYSAASNYDGDPERLIIVSDTDMPELYGDQACRRLLEEDAAKYKCVLMIGMSMDPGNEEYWNGVGIKDSFIRKRRTPQDLTDVIISGINTIINNPAIYRSGHGYRRTL